MVSMVFDFWVNKSFLDGSHPITIPKDLYSNLKGFKLDKRDYRIVYPK